MKTTPRYVIEWKKNKTLQNNVSSMYQLHKKQKSHTSSIVHQVYKHIDKWEECLEGNISIMEGNTSIVEGRKGGREEGKDFYISMLFGFYKKHAFAFLKTLKSV